MRFTYYLARITELGLTGLCKRLQARLKRRLFVFRHKTLPYKKASTYPEKFIHHLNFEAILQHPLFQKYLDPRLKNSEHIKKMADAAVNNCVEILERPVCLPANFSWHEDFKTQTSAEWKTAFYQDIKLKNFVTPEINPADYFPDAKIPWELSRMQHIFVLGTAYQSTKDVKYSTTFAKQVNSWIEQNPFLTGINWLCPMEVAIRSINLIWGIYFFHDAKEISQDFWQKLTNSLHEHAIYLEHNWETSDKPNNHYIADLIGYYYLCTLFKNNKNFEKKLYKCKQWLLEQFDLQIQPDGTSYEGSTAYHRLVAEMFLHFKLLCEIQNIALPKTFENKFETCLQFLDQCTASSGELVQIGDNDSGKILAGLFVTPQNQQTPQLQTFSNFGLTIIKSQSPNIHLSFRTPANSKTQPTGHFHNDQLAITLNVDGMPVLTDSGSYLYTPNTWWRNQMRSATNHNTFYFKNHEEALAYQENTMFKDLFQFPFTSQCQSPIINKTGSMLEISSSKIEPSLLNVSQTRKIGFDFHKKTLQIFDSVTTNNIDFNTQNLEVEWALNFGPKIELEKLGKGEWGIIMQNDRKIFINSSLHFTETKGNFSSAYGQIMATTKLVAQTALLPNLTTTITLLL